MIHAVFFLNPPVKVRHFNLRCFLKRFLPGLFIGQPHLACPESRRPLIIASRPVKMVYAGGRRKFVRKFGSCRLNQFCRLFIGLFQHLPVNFFVLQQCFSCLHIPLLLLFMYLPNQSREAAFSFIIMNIRRKVYWQN